MSDLKLGQIITTPQNRDAIHVAVAPITATKKLFPGEHTGIKRGTSESDENAENIGVVDPFLKDSVKRGETCWLFLYPNTVTGLRHEWTHPAFATPPINHQPEHHCGLF